MVELVFLWRILGSTHASLVSLESYLFPFLPSGKDRKRTER